MKKRWMIYPMLLIMLLMIGGVSVEAVYEGIPNVSLSPDGNAFTTHVNDTDTEWYEREYEVHTGVKSSMKEPGIGEHEYATERVDRVPV